MCLAAVSLSAQPFTLDLFTLDLGGAESTGGDFALTNSISQPEPVVLTGGGFQLEGTFWPVAAIVPIEAGPRLEIELGGGAVVLSWTPATPDFVLQQSDELGGPWQNAPSGAQNPATISAGTTAKFFRLFKP